MKTHRTSRSLTYLNKKFPIQPDVYLNSSFIILKKMAYTHFKSKYTLPADIYNIIIINQLIHKSSTHIVAQYKDKLLYEDSADYLQKKYKRSEIKINLPQILEYYNCCSVIFPNYVMLYESKYIYKNIQKKQKVIDFQQQQEIEREKKMRNCSNRSSSSSRDGYDDASDKVFDTQVFDSLLNQTNTSSIQQLLGFKFDDRSESINGNNKTMYNRDDSIEELIESIDKAEKSRELFIENHTHSSIRKYTTTIKYSNCTTTTKDKSSSISNQQQHPSNRKVIICHKISNSKDTRLKMHHHQKTNNYCKSPSRPISIDASNNTSIYKDTLHVSSSSKNTFIINHNRKVTSQIKNTLSVPKIDSLIANPSITSRENISKHAMIDLLASRIMKMKSIPKQHQHHIPEAETNLHHTKQNRKSLNLALSFGLSSLNNKIFKLRDQFIAKETPNNSNGNNSNNNNKTKKKIISYNNKSSNTNILSSNKPTQREPSSKKAFNSMKGNANTNNSKNGQFSISPHKQVINTFITKTCTHLPSKNKNAFNEDNKRASINALLPSKDSVMKSIQLKGIDYLNKNDSRNDCNTDRTYYQRASFKKAK